jgi:hypothetical protein
MTYQLNLDIASDCPISSFFLTLQQYSASIVNYNLTDFPNPNFTISFPTQQHLDNFKTTHSYLSASM